MMKRNQKNLGLHTALVFLSTLCGSYAAMAGGNLPAPERDHWRYVIAPYGWISSLKGDVTVGDRTAHMDVPFSKILSKLQFAAQGHFEGSKGPWTVMLDPTYLKIADERQRKIIGLKITSETTLVDAGVFYRLNSEDDQASSFEVLGGARYLKIKNTLDFKRLNAFTKSTQLTAPIVGARFKTPLSPKSQFWLRGDVGGFHIDDVKQTWSATAGIAYAYKPNVDLGLAYRVLKIDFTKSAAAVNLLMYGPMVGIAFHN